MSRFWGCHNAQAKLGNRLHVPQCRPFHCCCCLNSCTLHPAPTVKDINVVMGGEREIPGELPTSVPITSSPLNTPVLHMNSYSIWGALLRLVNRPLHP